MSNGNKYLNYTLDFRLLKYGVYLLIGATIISLFLKLLIEWIAPDISKKVIFSPINVLLWNLYSILASILINLSVFSLITIFLPKKDNVNIRNLILTFLVLISLLILGIANVFVILFCNLTDAVVSVICICAIFSISPYVGFALFLLYEQEIKKST